MKNPSVWPTRDQRTSYKGVAGKTLAGEISVAGSQPIADVRTTGKMPGVKQACVQLLGAALGTQARLEFQVCGCGAMGASPEVSKGSLAEVNRGSEPPGKAPLSHSPLWNSNTAPSHPWVSGVELVLIVQVYNHRESARECNAADIGGCRGLVGTCWGAQILVFGTRNWMC